MTPETILEVLRYTRPEFIDVMNQQSDQSPFEGLYMPIPVKDGVLNFGAMARKMRFEEFLGELKPIGWDAKALTKTVQLFTAGLEIPRHVLEDLENIVGDAQLNANLKDGAEDAIQQRDELMLGELEDNGTDITGSAFFGTNKAIPNARAGVTLTNSVSSLPADPTPDELRDALPTIRETFYAMPAANGRDYHRPSTINKQPIIGLFPTGMVENAMKAFAEDLVVSATTGAGSNVYKGMCEPRLIQSGTSNVAYFAIRNAARPALALADVGPPQVESNAGEMGGSPDRVDRSMMVFQTALFAWRYRTTALRGNPWSIVKATFDG